MNFRQLLLIPLAILVIAPVTLVALIFTCLLITGFLAQSQTEFDDLGFLSFVAFAIVVAGWIGLITLWRLYFHFRKFDFSPGSETSYFFGLLCGCGASIALVWAFSSAGTVGPAIFSGWPLLAALTLGVLLLVAKPKA